MIDADPTAILNNSLPKVAPTDPPQLPFNNDPTKEDEFVLTTYGPGKIKSSRVEQNAIDNDDHTIDTIFRPTIINMIDLLFGICHVPANKVTSIAGTSYIEKTVRNIAVNVHH